LKFRPFDGGRWLHRALPLSKNDAEQLEGAPVTKTRRFWYFASSSRESSFALCRERRAQAAMRYAQTTKNQPNWFNMSTMGSAPRTRGRGNDQRLG